MSMFMEINKILSTMQVVAARHGVKTPHIDKLTTYKFTNMNSSENITESNVVENKEENKASVIFPEEVIGIDKVSTATQQVVDESNVVIVEDEPTEMEKVLKPTKQYRPKGKKARKAANAAAEAAKKAAKKAS